MEADRISRSISLARCLQNNLFLSVISLLLILTACSGPSRNAVPKKYASVAEIEGIPNARVLGGKRSEILQAELVDTLRRRIKYKPSLLNSPESTTNILAISGGGGDGAYSVGILNGWTDSGKRPEFNLVTGVSVGALIAPFAFLGPKYDHVIKEIFTTITSDDIFTTKPIILSIIGSDSLADTTPLVQLIAKYVDKNFLAEVATAHDQGRWLLIATTNLDQRRFTIWNLTAIAASRTPRALDLFRQVMLASASIPIAFPPAYIEVVANGQKYDEMHVDGGVLTEVFFYGFTINVEEALNQLGIKNKLKPRIFIIRNNKTLVAYQQVEPGVFPIAKRALAGLTTSQGIGDLYRIYTITKKDNVDFNLAVLPSTYRSKAKELFDKEDMNRLYEIGYDQAVNGFPWQKYPPLYQPD